jgi:hypothetical protein
MWAGMAADIEVIWVKSEREYFCKGDWTTQISLNLKKIFVPSRRACAGMPS